MGAVGPSTSNVDFLCYAVNRQVTRDLQLSGSRPILFAWIET